MKTRYIRMSLLIGLVVLFVAGIGIRREVLQAQYRVYGSELPFTLESALEFRYVRMLVNQGSLPENDHKVQVPGGITIRETYTIGAEYVYASFSRWLWPAQWPLTERVRWIAVVWFCLGIPLVCLWLWWWLGSAWAAGVGGAYYAVALSSVIRSTGQELSHENFALPLLIGHIACQAWAGKRKDWRGFAWGSCGSALLLALSLATWDLIQYYIILWGLISLVRYLSGALVQDSRAQAQWGLVTAGLLIAGMVNPYLRAHDFPLSPIMLAQYGIGIGLLAEKIRGRRDCPPVGHIYATPSIPSRSLRVVSLRLAWVAAVCALGLLMTGVYAETYGHFAELMWAKLRFLNQKPQDPSLLTFDQRILWTPALNSVNLQLTLDLFPIVWAPSLLAIGIIVCNNRWRSNSELIQLLWCFGLSWAAFILFARFHVFLAVFSAGLLGWFAWWGRQNPSRLLRGCLMAGLLVVLGAEAAQVLRNPEQWGRPLSFVREQDELIAWMKDHTQGDQAVLANFGLSATLLTYADCPIILHPKFESVEIRRRVRGYGEALFLKSEKEFRDWADRYGARYYVYAMGEFASMGVDLQMRYFVDALRPPADAAARLFEYKPDKGDYFIRVWDNAKYRVFRIVTLADERMAERLVWQAEDDFSGGRLKGAEDNATLALLYQPRDQRAMKILLHVESLREKGVALE